MAVQREERDAPRAGISSQEAAARLARYGPQRDWRPTGRAGSVLEFLARFRNPLVLLLLAASAVSALTGEVESFVIITAIVVMSVTLDFVQEHRAGQAAPERLKASVAVQATALRDGTPRQVPGRRARSGRRGRPLRQAISFRLIAGCGRPVTSS